MPRPPFELEFDVRTIKHLGLQMYSTLPPVIGELVSNAWDADATRVEVTVPTTAVSPASEITVIDDGVGMDDGEVRNAYLIIGRDRRLEDNRDTTDKGRPVMGRKGIGKFSAFGIAEEIEVESVKKGEVSRFVINYRRLQEEADKRKIQLPALSPTGAVSKGTRVTLRAITKYHNRPIDLAALRRGLARRFSIIGPQHGFEVFVNGSPITVDERDLQRLLDKDEFGRKYLWEFKDEEIAPDSGWRVSGWIGTLDRTKQLEDGILRGVVLMARGKMVQEPFVFDAVVGQQFALSYLVGEIHAEFVDDAEDTIATTRNSLVWDTEANRALKKWGEQRVNSIARQWAERRKAENERQLQKNPVYKKFAAAARQSGSRRVRRVADRLIREIVTQNPNADVVDQEPVIQMCLDFMEFDAFQELAEEIGQADLKDVAKVLNLFREWEVVEAKEMMRVTAGRITTIETLQALIDTNALEVPTLHNFLKEFPWVLDPKWSLVADEVTYSELLRQQFPEPEDMPEVDRRIDFLCVSEADTLVVVEIKRPGCKASRKQLDQVEDYVLFMRGHVETTSDPEMKFKRVVGYLLCGEMVDTPMVRNKREALAMTGVYVRRYRDLLRMVKDNHRDFLDRYDRLQKAKQASLPAMQEQDSLPASEQPALPAASS